MSAPLLPTDPDALAAMFVLHPTLLPRNRHFTLHATRAGKVARSRAARVKGVLQHITGAFGPASHVGLEKSSTGEFLLRYRLRGVAVERWARFAACDLALLRVALRRTGVRLLPAVLIPSEDEQETIRRLVAPFVVASSGSQS
ncbi:MAG: hypothetical protein NVS3B20_26660 [Polyangiales bacterium]